MADLRVADYANKLQQMLCCCGMSFYTLTLFSLVQFAFRSFARCMAVLCCGKLVSGLHSMQAKVMHMLIRGKARHRALVLGRQFLMWLLTGVPGYGAPFAVSLVDLWHFEAHTFAQRSDRPPVGSPNRVVWQIPPL